MNAKPKNGRHSLVLVDGNSLAFRSFFALLTSRLRRSDGTPTWAVYGFFNSLFDVLDKQSPDCVAICFDVAKKTFRHEQYADYKAGRHDMPDDLSVQWPILKEGIRLLGIPIWEIEGYEADDVIGTVAKRAEEKSIRVQILTGDKDAFQLLDDNIEVLMPVTNQGVVTYHRQEVFDKLGVWPEQVIDYKGLCGDASDNIPGVKGIGPKTAVPLLAEYKTIEGIYENIDKIASASVKKKLIENEEIARKSKELATIKLDVPIDFDFEHCTLQLPDIPQVAEYFRSLESGAILRRLPKILRSFNKGQPVELDESLFQPASKQREKMSFKKESTTVSAESGGGEEAPRGGVAVAQQQLLNLNFPATKLEAVDTRIVCTDEDLQEVLTELDRQQIIGVEVLTNSLQSLEGSVVGYALAWHDAHKLSAEGRPELERGASGTKSVYIPVRHIGINQLSHDLVTSKLKAILEKTTAGKISYNAKWAINACSLAGIKLSGLAFDPMLASYIVNPDQNHKLKEQARVLLGYNMESPADLLGSGKKQQCWDAIPAPNAAKYAAEAARISLELAAYYGKLLDDDQQDLLWNIDLPLSVVLAEMEQNGVHLDIPYFKEYSVELQSELSRLEKEIYELSGHPFNINSPLQLQKVLFDELKLPTKGKTGSGSGYSTDASVLEALSSEHAIVRKILEYRQLSKLNSTYVEALPQQVSTRDGRLHGEFNQTSTSTGRLSSTNPNLQNIPIRTEMGLRIRRGFIPSQKTNVILSADYSQIELRLLAHMSGDEKLIEAFRNNEDIHSRTAMEVFDLKANEVTADHRRIGKTLNFALIYQQGAFATGQSLGISTKEAQKFIDKYFTTFGKVRAFMATVLEEARRTGYVQTLWGRKRYFQNLNDRNDMVRKQDERAAFNAPLQGSAADLIKLAMIKLQRDLKEQGLAAQLILQVHDELVLEVPKNEVEETREVVRAAMAQDQPLKVPLQVDVGVGPNWMEAK